MAGIDKLIINSAYREPEHHWKYDMNGQTFVQEPGRRPAGYFIAGQGTNQYNDIGKFIELDLVNRIRPRVKAWRENGYPGVTGVTKKLLEHWNDKDARQYQFFFCQLDAMETLIWLVEAPAAEKVGIDIPSDGGAFRRICTKLCTGGGKTTVMAMLIAWMVCNKATYPQDKRFSKYIFIVAPGLTVRSRLQVLQTGGADNYYAQFGVVPIGLMDKLRQGKVMITNWQALAWETDEAIAKRKSVDKRGAKSDEAYVREVLGEMANAQNIVVINDEAHHAWRKNPENKGKTKEEKEAEKQATIWVSGLDRINRVRNILCCYDFSATPFAPSGKKNDEEALFSWIVSDFGLNDGIEAGLVKTPRVVVRDDSMPNTSDFKSKLYHIYADETVKDDINRAAKEEEPLPDLITQAYYLLGKDWQALYEAWNDAGCPVPPVMITVANRTETAARIKYAFDHQRIPVPELCNPDLTLRIDSKTLDEAESATGSKAEAAAALREMVDTVGQKGKTGEQIRNVISVGMLSEGWDAKTVTHILGLRAFSSQLLCEQVIGRGLRRTSYDLAEGSELFTPEYVNIFGIPFTFLPHESDEQSTSPVTPPKTQVEALKERSEYQISWPNIIRIDRLFKPRLKVDIDKIDTLTLQAAETRLRADLAPIIDGKTGEQIRNVISVGMLSEGWDAKTVTHILGLRAFSSQLLCEQVIGRGLRRTSYDLAEGSELFTPEYVNIFGIPFTFLPHESDEQSTSPVTPPKTQVEALKERSEYQISWPNIIRIDRLFKPRLKVDIDKIDTLTLQAAETRLRADLAPIIDGKTDLTKCTEIDLQKLDAELRMQRIVFEAAAQVYEQMNASWQNQGTKFALLGQVIQLTQKYIESGAIQIDPPLYGTDPVRRRIIYMMNMNRIVQHLWDFIRLEMTSKTVPVFDANRRVRSTADMPTWYTSKPCNITQHSQISHCVYDSGWEATEAYLLEKNEHVKAWAKNDHLGFEIVYVYEGVVRKYIPDYLVKLDNGKTLVLETKGRMTEKDIAKRKALSTWIEAVNGTGEFGMWCNEVSLNVADVDAIIAKQL